MPELQEFDETTPGLEIDLTGPGHDVYTRPDSEAVRKAKGVLKAQGANDVARIIAFWAGISGFATVLAIIFVSLVHFEPEAANSNLWRLFAATLGIAVTVVIPFYFPSKRRWWPFGQATEVPTATAQIQR